MNEAGSPILCQAFERFAAACRDNPSERGYLNYAEPHFERLTRDVALALPAYGRAAEQCDAGFKEWIRIVRAHRDLQTFLERFGHLGRIVSGEFDAPSAAAAFEEEVGREFCKLTQRFVLDGLELTSPELRFRRGRFVRLTESSFCEISGSAPKPYDRRLGFYALELHWRSPNPPWDDGFDDIESPHTRIHRYAHPWIGFINLWSRGKIRITGMFESTDSGLRSSHRYLETGEPVWEDHYQFNGERDVNEWVSESPRRTVSVSDEPRFVRFLERLDDGLGMCVREAYRADIAMRYYRRVVERFLDHHIGESESNPDHDEDIVVDAMITLEAILLANEKKGKGNLMAARAAAIIEDTDDKQRTVRKRLARLYDLRSRIVHGDARPSRDELASAAVAAEDLSRRCLSALLLSGGDRDGILRASTDPKAAEGLRHKIAL